MNNSKKEKISFKIPSGPFLFLSYKTHPSYPQYPHAGLINKKEFLIL